MSLQRGCRFTTIGSGGTRALANVVTTRAYSARAGNREGSLTGPPRDLPPVVRPRLTGHFTLFMFLSAGSCWLPFRGVLHGPGLTSALSRNRGTASRAFLREDLPCVDLQDLRGGRKEAGPPNLPEDGQMVRREFCPEGQPGRLGGVKQEVKRTGWRSSSGQVSPAKWGTASVTRIVTGACLGRRAPASRAAGAGGTGLLGEGRSGQVSRWPTPNLLSLSRSLL